MFSQRFKRLVPYAPGEQPQGGSYIKLNTNENPYPPAPEVAAALAGFDAAALRRYPDPKARRLREAVAEGAGLRAENVFAGNGSDEVLSFAFFAFFDGSDGPLLFPQYSYSFFPVYCDFYAIPYKRLPHNDDFTFRVSQFLEEPESCGAVLVNPNAPTGIAVTLAEIESLLERFPENRVVLIDEAYVGFGGPTAVPLVNRFPNLVVTQTYSKSRSLAGARLGFAFAQEPLIDAFEAAKDSFNSYTLDAVAQVVGTAAAGANDYYQSINDRIVATREHFTAAARRLGMRVLPSSTNFLFASADGLSGASLYRALKERSILVRHFDLPGIRDFVRITVGTDDEMHRLLEVLGGLLREPGR